MKERRRSILARHRSGYKFTEKKQSVRGITAFLLALVSIGIFVAAAFYSCGKKGNASMYLGSAGVAAMLLGIVAFVLAMFSLREENSFKLFPCLADRKSVV